MKDERNGEPLPVIKKNLPDVIYPGVPIAGADSEAPAVEPAEEATAYEPQFTPEEKKAYGTAALFSLVLLVVCLCFSNSFIENAFFSRKDTYGYVPLDSMKFFGIVPPPIFLVYCVLALGLPVLVALFARFVCSKRPISHRAWVWGVFLLYFGAIAIVAIRMYSKFLFLQCLIFFILCFVILLYDKDNKPKNVREFIDSTSEIMGDIYDEVKSDLDKK